MALQNFKATVIKKESLTDSVILLSFSVPDFSFKAGQFVTLKIEKDGESKLKSYSILNPPSQKSQLDLCIKIVDGGFASERFRETKVGDEYEVKGPFGHFTFRETSDSKEHWFLGAGTGVAPLHSMIKEYVGKFPDQKFKLFFGVRTKKDLFLNEDFKKIALKNANFDYHPTLSREKWDGDSEDEDIKYGRIGHVQDNLGDNLQNKTFYICGLKELVIEAKELLLSKGVAAEDIVAERYS